MDELYKRIEALCAEKGINITTMCKESGIPRSALSDYKAGRIKSLSTDKMAKIADYFGVTIDYLLGNEQKEKPGQKAEPEITFDDFTYAMHNETKELTEEDKELLLSLARQLNDARKGKDEESD